MLSNLARHWQLLLIRGIISVGFAIFAFINPRLAFDALVFALGIFFLADGALALYLGMQMRGKDEDWWIVILEGAIGAVLGILTFLNPELTASGVVTFVALWCLVTGVFEISTAIKLRKEIDNEWFLGLAGIISIAIGILMLVNPTAGAFSIVMWIGFYALLFGVLLIGLGLRLRKYRA